MPLLSNYRVMISISLRRPKIQKTGRVSQIKGDRKVGKFDLDYMRTQAVEIRKFLAITEREMAADYCPLKVYN